MAIPDLLWACPECGEDRGLVADGSRFRCRACDTVYDRGKGAAITARRPDGTRIVRSPAEWVDALPDPETIVRQRVEAGKTIRASRVEIQRVTGSETVHDEAGYLNRIEIWGEESPGTLVVGPDVLVFTPEEGNPESWPLETLTAVQASSHSLQINRRGAPLVSFRFLDDSIFLWEELLHAVLQAHYDRTGRGRIVEFQPRIVTE